VALALLDIEGVGYPIVQCIDVGINLLLSAWTMIARTDNPSSYSVLAKIRERFKYETVERALVCNL
jgi:hypothetical protein